MESVSDDQLQPLNAAFRGSIPGNPSPSTKVRWYTHGMTGVDGERLRLPVWYVGRKPYTTKAAIRQWLNEVTLARIARFDRQQKSNAEVTDDELRAAGLLGRSHGGAE